MKPRIFVSSTFYDLKYVREDLSNFIRVHDFEPIMFEDGDIGYTPGKPLDSSCYASMQGADMCLLIIGGNYGSAATGENENYSQFISITRNEFRRAYNIGVPVFVFIDNKVFIEYDIYEKNLDEINAGKEIRFCATKSVNVFSFIKEIRELGISITAFEKTVEIKDFLSKQWADMFKNYLSSLKENKQIAQLQDSMSDMNSLIKKMEIMMDAVGKTVLNGGEKAEYETVVAMQEKLELEILCNDLVNTISLSIKNLKSYDKEHIVNQFIRITCESIKNKNSDTIAVLKNAISLFAKYEFNVLSFSGSFVNYAIEINKIISNPENLSKITTELCKDKYYNSIFHDESICWEVSNSEY